MQLGNVLKTIFSSKLSSSTPNALHRHGMYYRHGAATIDGIIEIRIEMFLVGDLSIGIYQKVAMKSGKALSLIFSFSWTPS
ncbi:hypothetical protein SDJN02_13906, partial [Cucurbita argyrosperma subsp. argyrosperma]